MTTKMAVGLDGTPAGERAMDFASNLGKALDSSEIVLIYVIEWSPFSFQTPEENERRHKRREEEIKRAFSNIVDPAVQKLQAAGHNVTGHVVHGDVADMLEKTAVKHGASQIVVARSSEGGLSRLFGSSTSNLVMHSSIPVTVVG